jgi:hypothetical protein
LKLDDTENVLFKPIKDWIEASKRTVSRLTKRAVFKVIKRTVFRAIKRAVFRAIKKAVFRHVQAQRGLFSCLKISLDLFLGLPTRM